MPPIRLQILGSGTAFHTDGRGSQSLWVDLGGAAWLVDVGPTAVLVAERCGVDLGAIERLFVTHLHGDHTAGWPFLRLGLALGRGRTRPLDVHGPRGVRDCLEGLSELCYGELFRTAQPGFAVRFHEHEVREARGLAAEPGSFDVLPMDHHESSTGYRFEVAGRVLAVSGDTRWCENLERLARGAELLVLECTTVRPGPAAHVSLEELRRGVERLGACRIVLVHLTDAVAAGLATDPIPRVTAGHDGMVVEL